MVLKCSVFGCRSNYQKENSKKTVFEFPPHDDETFPKWVKFVNRKDVLPTTSSRICVDHFEKRYLHSGLSRINLLRELKPIPTIFGEQLLKSTPVSQLPSLTARRKPPNLRLSATREVNELENGEKISSFDRVNESICPRKFLFQWFGSHVLYYRIFCEEGNYCILEDHQKRVRQRAQFSYKIMILYFQLNIITINRNDTFYVLLTSPCAPHSTTSPLDSFTIVIYRSTRLRYTQTQSRDFVQSEPGPRVTLTPVKQIHKSQQ